MNTFYSNSALQQDDELVFQNIIPSFVCEQHTIPEDFVIDYSYSSLDLLDADLLAINDSMGGNNLTINEKGRKKQKSTVFRDGDENRSDEKQKRIILRDNERQRRQEMANLYASLRMELPLQYIKGKRSASDLLQAAANYTTYKEKIIQDLKIKRDTLKNLAAANDLSSTNQSYLPINVTVNAYLNGIEILISVDLRDDTFSLSRVLKLLLAEGLNVVSCFCTKVNGRILHTILTEASHIGGVDNNELQQKLMNIVNTPKFQVI